MIQLTSHSAEAYRAALSNIGGTVRKTRESQHAGLPASIGSGAWEHFRLQDGMEFSITRYRLERRMVVQVRLDQPMFTFGGLMEGTFEINSSRAMGRAMVAPGQGLNMWASEGKYCFTMPAGSYVSASILIDAITLEEKLGTADLLPQVLRGVLRRESFPAFLKANALSAIAIDACRCATCIPPEDPLRLLLLESCALTVLREQLMSLFPKKKHDPTMSRRERECLEAVRELLIAHPERSPSLGELARHVGLNEFSLKRGFRMHFGRTVYGFLRTHRMEVADRRIRERDRSIAEIATEVGYSSSGRFAAAFRKHFGVSPKERQLQLRHD